MYSRRLGWRPAEAHFWSQPATDSFAGRRTALRFADMTYGLLSVRASISPQSRPKLEDESCSEDLKHKALRNGR